ncbi:tyrosine-type recombinase/integrase [Sphingomonas sp. CD22]|uniref:site-specific integrase n=1 Tax=Sphingomonas sp. CD22 TaxID=3100214 RepID=UPI002AE09D05|nr:tyrosine-type recombinase/integrase [Sphingomonas sp. CD22]MEA1085879.1 tyrosine-type recombinase/integrase [Sphingomonas sp. CD22]
MSPPRHPAPSNDPAATTLAARTPDQPALPAILNDKIEQAAAYARAARAGATRRAYESDWAIFTAWCAAHRLVALPATPEVVAVFASDQAVGGLNPATIGRRIAAIGHYHRAGGHPAPTALPTAGRLAEVLAGIRAEHGGAKRRKQPADAAALRNMLAAIEGDGLRAVRDRAILAIGMAAALRRSEIVALGVEHVGLVPEGLRLTIARSKTDRAGAGAVIAIPEGSRIRPKALLLAWMAAAGHAAGPLFRRLSRSDALTEDAMSDRAIARLVQQHAAAAGYDPTQFAGHSLRAGFLTEGAAQGATIFKLQEVSRHKSVQVLSDYVRDAELFRDHAGQRFL